MNGGADRAGSSNVDRAELIKWWNALDALSMKENVERELQMVRECRHPDAQWLAALFPSDGVMTSERVCAVLGQHLDDSRAGFLLWKLSRKRDAELLRRVAEAGYAPAQAELCFRSYRDQGANFAWAEKSAAGDRHGLYQLAECVGYGIGCSRDMKRALELYRQAAEMEHPLAMVRYGGLGFGAQDWERFHWWGLAAERGWDGMFRDSVLPLVTSFEKGECGRILHTVGPVISRNLDAAKCAFFRFKLDPDDCRKLERLVALYDAMMGRARGAIHCWSIAGRRLRVVKDMRVVIAKMVWAEAWRWGGKEQNEIERDEEASKKVKRG
jgi:hypothetical protein